jgi:hypothetical protein
MKTLVKLFYLLPVVVVLGLVGFLVLNRSKPPVRVMTGRPFATTPITNLTASLFTSENQLGPAGNDVFIEFRDAAGKLADVGDVKFELSLSVPSAIITHITFKVLRTSTPGQYRVTVHPQIAGEWQAKLTITNLSASAEASFPVSVK